MTAESPAPPVPPQARLDPAAYAAARATMWTGSSVMITDPSLKVLIANVPYREKAVLIGGGVERAEAPFAAARREAGEETGTDVAPGRLLAVDWVPINSDTAHKSAAYPGELIFVFDGPTLTAGSLGELRPQIGEITSLEFVDPGDLATRLRPGDARRALAALRARVDGTTAYLEDGHPHPPCALHEHDLLTGTPPAPATGRWHRRQTLPEASRVRAVRGWVFARDGRVLLLHDPVSGQSFLPGGDLDADDLEHAPSALTRWSALTARTRPGRLQQLGYYLDTNDPNAGLNVRVVGALGTLNPSQPDPTGRHHVRLLASPEQAAELLRLGAAGLREAADAAEAAEDALNTPRARRSPVTEIPPGGTATA